MSTARYWRMYIVMVKQPGSKIYEPYFGDGACYAHETRAAARNSAKVARLDHPGWKIYIQKVGAIS